jgi:hypothetical protein
VYVDLAATFVHVSRRRAPAARRRPGAPLSFGQLRLWISHELAPTSTAYNSTRALRLTGELDVAARWPP